MESTKQTETEKSEAEGKIQAGCRIISATGVGATLRRGLLGGYNCTSASASHLVMLAEQG